MPIIVFQKFIFNIKSIIPKKSHNPFKNVEKNDILKESVSKEWILN